MLPDWCEELLSEPERARADSFNSSGTTTVRGRHRSAQGRRGGIGGLRSLRREAAAGVPGLPTAAPGAPRWWVAHRTSPCRTAPTCWRSRCVDGPVGVDVEQVNPDVDMDGMLRFVFGDAERGFFDEISGRQARLEAFFQCWTRKESVLKRRPVTGCGSRCRT